MNPVQDLIHPQILARIAFGVVLLVTFSGAVIAVGPRNILYNVLGLALCLTGVAGLFVYLGSPFIALLQVLIYIGAICIAIVFAIMLSRPLHLSIPRRRASKVGLALVVSALIVAMLGVIIWRTGWQPAAVRSSDGSVATLGLYLITRYNLTFELMSLMMLVAILGAVIIAGYARRRSS